MTISRSLNFSLFQSSSSSNPKEEDLQEEEEDYDWGELLNYWTVQERRESSVILVESNLSRALMYYLAPSHLLIGTL